MVLPSQPLKKAVQGAVVIHTPRSLLEDLNALTLLLLLDLESPPKMKMESEKDKFGVGYLLL